MCFLVGGWRSSCCKGEIFRIRGLWIGAPPSFCKAGYRIKMKLVAGCRSGNHRGCCGLSFSLSTGKSVQDRADNSVAASNTKDEGKQNGKEHGGGSQNGIHCPISLMVLFLGRLVSPARCIVGNIGSNVCITAAAAPLVLHHALWS